MALICDENAVTVAEYFVPDDAEIMTYYASCGRLDSFMKIL